MVKHIYKVGDKVFAKVKGHPLWPARIEGDTGKKKYNVLFYGTHETGAIKPEDICYYLKNKNLYVHKYTKRAGYEEAVKQIEAAIKEDGGDGDDNTSGGNDTVNELEMSDTSSISSASEKKAPKRRVASLPDEPTTQKKPGRPRRRSMATVDSKEDHSDEPVIKKPRRKSNASSDNGLKEGIPEEEVETMGETKEEEEDSIVNVEKQKENGSKTSKIEKEKNEKDDTNAPNHKLEESETKASPVKANKNEEDSKEPKETEFIEIKNNGDTTYQMEEEITEAPDEAEKTLEKASVKVEIVTEQMLNNNILYAEHVKKNVNLYKDKSVEARHDDKDQVLAVKLPSGTMCGIKLHKVWPLDHSNEHERALYDEQVAKSVLEIKDLITSKNTALDDVDADIVPDIQMTLENIKELTYGRDIESKRKRLDRLKREADLVTWDSKIKSNLGLDKAMPDTALDCLKEFSKLEKDVDALMFTKHPHVLDTIRRLRKYVGNIKEWDMTSKDMEIFTKKAEKIRTEAERIYNKIKNVVKVNDEKAFWDSFMDLVSDFRIKCKDLSESEILVLCAEPDSRQAFLDKLDEVTESEGTNLNASNTSEPVLKETSVQGWTEKK